MQSEKKVDGGFGEILDSPSRKKKNLAVPI
jgi:hypothetical protein